MSAIATIFAVIGGIVCLFGVVLIFFNLAELGYERWLAYRGYTEQFREFLIHRADKRRGPRTDTKEKPK